MSLTLHSSGEKGIPVAERWFLPFNFSPTSGGEVSGGEEGIYLFMGRLLAPQDSEGPH